MIRFSSELKYKCATRFLTDTIFVVLSTNGLISLLFWLYKMSHNQVSIMRVYFLLLNYIKSAGIWIVDYFYKLNISHMIWLYRIINFIECTV